MNLNKSDLSLNLKILGDNTLHEWIDEFLLDKKIQNVSKRTLTIYGKYLRRFSKFCGLEGVDQVMSITPSVIRKFLFYLDQKGHNPGGIHIYYRTIKTFLFWWENEVEPEGFKNPIRKVDAPRLKPKPLEPVSIGEVEKLIKTCDKRDFYDLRDQALFLFLLDTGARATETTNINLDDINLRTGEILIRSGKGGKHRKVFIGKTTRKAVRTYLKVAARKFDDQNKSLWISKSGNGLGYSGLNLMIRRRSKMAGIEKPSAHDFRRAFALNFLRNGGDIYSLQKLMGHADLQVLRRYLAQTTDDLREVHHRYSPVDKNL